MRYFLIIILGLVALYDGFTTVLGTAIILGESTAGISVSILFSLIILAFMISTYPIWDTRVINNWVEKQATEGCLLYFIRFIWIAAFIYDLYTSYSGNKALITGNRQADAGQEAIFIGLTLMVSASPIFLSYLLSIISQGNEA